MSKGTTLRNIRINDELWEAVKAAAADEGLTVSDVTRDLLDKWVMRHARKRSAGS